MHLTPTEWHLVEILVRNPGKLVSQRQLLQEVWGPRYEDETNYLRVYMAQIRRKLEPDPAHPRYFITEPGMGYRFEGERRHEQQASAPSPGYVLAVVGTAALVAVFIQIRDDIDPVSKGFGFLVLVVVVGGGRRAGTRHRGSRARAFAGLQLLLPAAVRHVRDQQVRRRRRAVRVPGRSRC